MLCSTRVVPSSSGVRTCRATVSAPGDRDSHAHERPGMSSVTCQVTRGSRGCLMRTAASSAKVSPRTNVISSIDAVHSGQRSTSR